MLERARRMHERVIARVHLIDTVDVVAIASDGTETTRTVPAQVQNVSQVSGQAPADITDTLGGQNVLWAYLPRGTGVQPGNRIVWNGVRWEAMLTATSGTVTPYERILIGRETVGTAFLEVTVYRRRDGVTTTVGTFVVQRVENEPRGGEDTTGWAATGVLIGGADLGAVVAGDWFELDEMPAQVTSVDASSEGRVEASYRRQAAAP